MSYINVKSKDSVKQRQRGQQLEEELKIREQELEFTMNKQKEVCIGAAAVFI